MYIDENYNTLWFLIISTIVLGPIFSSMTSYMMTYEVDSTVQGYTDRRYQKVLEEFRRNFGEGLEKEGAAVSVHHNGRRVVHLWGGHSDSTTERKWTSSTRMMLFSVTKAVSSVCIAMLVDRGYISYNDRIVSFWPEYGQNGKENTTVEDVLTHQAGLPYLDRDISIEEAKNTSFVLELLEKSSTVWTPGTGSGYHPVTFGYLVDGIILRVDPKGRNLRNFFLQEIAHTQDLSMDIGASREESPYLARIVSPTLKEYVRDIYKDPRILPMLFIMYGRFWDDIISRITASPSWIKIDSEEVSLNDPDVAEVSLGAVTGISSADHLAQLFARVLDGTLVSNRTLQLLTQPTLNSWHVEKVTLWPLIKGHGFFYNKHPHIYNEYTFGHPGYGGQYIHVDPHRNLVIAYLSNGLKTGSAELCSTYMRLQNAVYNSIPYNEY